MKDDPGLKGKGLPQREIAKQAVKIKKGSDPISRMRRMLTLGAGATALASIVPRAWAVLAAAKRSLAENPLIGARRQALVIGNSNYAKAGVLRNPRNDAAAMTEALKGSGFEVATYLDVTRAPMLGAVAAFGERVARDKAIGVFYFAGHGVQFSWRNYLLPVDASVSRMDDLIAQAFDLNALIESIRQAGNPMNLIILDACRDNPFGRDFLLPQKGLSQIDAPPGTLLAYATAPGNVAIDGDGVNGLYTEHLLAELQDPEAKIEDVFKRVRLEVRRKSSGRQIPWESTSLEYDFYFRRPKEIEELARADATRREENERKLAEARRKDEVERAQAEAARQAGEERARADAAKKAEEARVQEEARKRGDEERAQAEADRKQAEALARADAERRRAEASAAAERRRQEELAYYQRLENERKAESERRYEAELALYQSIQQATDPAPLVDYLRKYPSGNFAELVQHRLDELLRKQGEQRIEIAPAAGNPYTKGTVRLDTRYKVGDSYTHRELDLHTGVEKDVRTIVVTEISETEIRFDGGKTIVDPMGNLIASERTGFRFVGYQLVPTEFSVGHRWTTRYRSERADGLRREVEASCVVADKETVIVPAGSFECYRVDTVGYSESAQGGFGRLKGGFNRLEFKNWFAPDRVRQAVRSDRVVRNQTTDRLIDSRRWELVAFRQS